MNRAELTELEGNILLHLNFSGISDPQEFELVIAEAEALRHTLIKKQKDKLLLIADFTESIFSPEVYDILARYRRLATALTEKHAIVGLKPVSLIKTILRTYTDKEVHSFKTKQAALEWLVKTTAKKQEN